MFRFIFIAEPTAGAEQAADIASARVVVWVNDSDKESAEAKARAYIMDCSWVVEKLQSSEHWPDKLCPDQDTQSSELAQYRKAEIRGISALFHARPKVPRPGVYEIRPLGEPLTPGGKQ